MPGQAPISSCTARSRHPDGLGYETDCVIILCRSYLDPECSCSVSCLHVSLCRHHLTLPNAIRIVNQTPGIQDQGLRRCKAALPVRLLGVWRRGPPRCLGPPPKPCMHTYYVFLSQPRPGTITCRSLPHHELSKPTGHYLLLPATDNISNDADMSWSGASTRSLRT